MIRSAPTGPIAGPPRAVLLTLLVGIAAANFPTTLLITSLETIRKDLHSTFGVVSWVTVAPSLAYAVAIPTFGKIGDLWGARRVYRYGLAVSTAGSLATVFAWNAGALIAVRTVSQMGVAACGPAAYAMIASRFEGSARIKAVSIYTAVSGASPVIGIAVGGLLIDKIGWRSVFLAQFFPSVLALVLAFVVLPETLVARRAVHFDIRGAALLGSGAASFLFGVNRIRGWGIGHPVVIGCLAASPVLFALFVVTESRHAHPLLPLRYLRRRSFSASIANLTLSQSALLGTSVITPLLMQRRYGYSVSITSYLIIVRPMGYSIGAWLSGGLRRRFGAFKLLVVSCIVQAGSTACYALGSIRLFLPIILIGLITAGLGSGTTQTTLYTAVIDSVDVADAGVGNATASMAGSLGVAVGATALSAIVGDSAASGPFVVAFLLAAAVGVLSVFTALLSRPAKV